MEFIRIRNLREDKDLRQKDIAKVLGISQQYYSEYENGKRKFNNDVVKELADYYNIKVSDIVD